MTNETAHHAPDTRTTLLKTAWRLIEKRGVARVTLGDIADAAGVSRQAIYQHFGSRAGLLIAMTRHRDATSKAAREMMVVARKTNSRAGFGQFIRLWFRHVAAILPVARSIEAAAVGDEDARAVWDDRMEELRKGMRTIVDSLATAGQLADRWTREEATDWFWSRTHIDVWSHLTSDRQWPPEQVVRRVTDSLWSDLVDPSRGAKGR
jgi:AcrR family transcriptional regulator